MNFIFRSQQEGQVNVEKGTSKLFLVAIGILLVVLFLFVSFENLYYEESNTPVDPFHASTTAIHGKTLHKPDLPNNDLYLSIRDC